MVLILSPFLFRFFLYSQNASRGLSAEFVVFTYPCATESYFGKYKSSTFLRYAPTYLRQAIK